MILSLTKTTFRFIVRISRPALLYKNGSHILHPDPILKVEELDYGQSGVWWVRLKALLQDTNKPLLTRIKFFILVWPTAMLFVLLCAMNSLLELRKFSVFITTPTLEEDINEPNIFLIPTLFSDNAKIVLARFWVTLSTETKLCLYEFFIGDPIPSGSTGSPRFWSYREGRTWNIMNFESEGRGAYELYQSWSALVPHFISTWRKESRLFWPLLANLHKLNLFIWGRCVGILMKNPRTAIFLIKLQNCESTKRLYSVRNYYTAQHYRMVEDLQKFWASPARHELINFYLPKAQQRDSVRFLRRLSYLFCYTLDLLVETFVTAEVLLRWEIRYRPVKKLVLYMAENYIKSGSVAILIGELGVLFYIFVFFYFFLYTSLTWVYTSLIYAGYTFALEGYPLWYLERLYIFEAKWSQASMFWSNLISPHTYLFGALLMSSAVVLLVQLSIQKNELNLITEEQITLKQITSPKVWLSLIWITLSYQLLYVYKKNLFAASIVWHVPQELFDGLQTQIMVNLDVLSFKFVMITLLIGAATNLYIPIYMKNEPNLNRFVLLINGFLFSMLILLTSGNLITLLVGWELIGVFSYLLINFWVIKITSFKSAFKALTYNQISDVSLIAGIVLYYSEFNTVNFFEMNDIPNMGGVGVAALLLFYISACCKSAQIFFHFWLPDSMEAPVPASALIHSATLVSAGIFLMLKMKPLVAQSLMLETVIIISASLTVIVGGVSAILQNDLKKILAFSTISNCGLIMLFTCITTVDNCYLLFAIHGIFKAYTFFCAGSLIVIYAHKQDWRYVSAISVTHPSLLILLMFGLYNLGAWDNSLYYFSKHNCMGNLLTTGSYLKESLISISLMFTTVTSALYSLKIVYLVNFRTLNNLKYVRTCQRLASLINTGAFVLVITIGLFFYNIELFGPFFTAVESNLNFVNLRAVNTIFIFLIKLVVLFYFFQNLITSAESYYLTSLMPLIFLI